MKIGDRVKVIGTGRTGIICDNARTFDFRVRFNDGTTELFMRKSLELCLENYELIEVVSVRNLDEKGACQEELQKFATIAMKAGYGWTTSIKLQDVICFAEKCKGGIKFLLEKGFIQEKKPEFKYEVGGLYKNKRHEDIYILSSIEIRKYALINLNDGNRWSDPKPSKEKVFNGEEHKFEKLEGCHIKVMED